MRKLIEDIMYDRRNDFTAKIVKVALVIASIFYGWFMFIRNFLYDKGKLKILDVPARVISIGNLSVGGTGKTPAVIKTAGMLMEKGKKVAVVSRGYGRKSKGEIIVSDGEKILAASSESGDEPHIIASKLPGAPVIVGNNRYNAAKLACDRFHPNVIILDDGFQHRGLYRDIDVLSMDAEDPMSGENIIPRGRLRESPYAGKRAKAIIVNRFREGMSRERTERMIRYYIKDIPIFFSRNKISQLREMGGGQTYSGDFIKGRKVYAMSNVANPDSFHNLIESAGGLIVLKAVFPDHHAYNKSEIDKTSQDALSQGAEFIVITEKDERNFPDGFIPQSIKILVLELDIEFLDKEEEYLKIINLKENLNDRKNRLYTGTKRDLQKNRPS